MTPGSVSNLDQEAPRTIAVSARPPPRRKRCSPGPLLLAAPTPRKELGLKELGLDELGASLAHELNQPLTAIGYLAEACRRYLGNWFPEGGKPIELLGEIANQSTRAAQMIQHLRSVLDKGKPEFEPVDLGDVVLNAPHLMGREVEEKRIAMRVHVPAGRLDVDADRVQIEEVLVNLIQNAIDSIQEANGSERMIEVSARPIRGVCEVSVRDTGTGLPPSVAGKMFAAFYTTKAKGLGIGLSISRSIVEAHRGRIWTETPPDGGPGLVVLFSIPLR